MPLINRQSRWGIVGFASLLLLHYILGLSATLNKCTTFDEIFHVVGGYSYNRFGDFRLQPENGMLPQRWLALPLVFQKLDFPPPDTPAWKTSNMSAVGYLFFYKSGNDPDKLLFTCRAMNGLWSLATGSLMFVWMRRIGGARSAWFTLILWAMCPTFLANGFLATSDIAATFFFLAAAGSLWSVLHVLNWKRTLICALAMAGLFLSKFSAPIIIPIGLIMAIMRLVSPEPWSVQWRGDLLVQSRWLRALLMLSLAIFLIAFTWCMIWSGYGFRYSAFNPTMAKGGELSTPWDTLLAEPNLVSQTIEVFREHRILPEAYLYGFLFTHHNSKSRRAFLLGEFGLEGWFGFFPYCFFAKTPTGTLLLIVIAGITTIVRLFKVPSTERFTDSLRAIYQTTPLWGLFCIYWCFAISSHLNIGHRHILPTYGPMLMFAGMAAWWCQASQPIVRTKKKATRPGLATWFQRRRWPMRCAGTLGCVVATTAASLGMWPNYLAFFNMPSGGPKHAWKKLVDSSLDWGQDLPSLRVWIESEQKRNSLGVPIYLSYFGTGDPEFYGIKATLLPGFLTIDRSLFLSHCGQASIVLALH